MGQGATATWDLGPGLGRGLGLGKLARWEVPLRSTLRSTCLLAYLLTYIAWGLGPGTLGPVRPRPGPALGGAAARVLHSLHRQTPGLLGASSLLLWSMGYGLRDMGYGLWKRAPTLHWHGRQPGAAPGGPTTWIQAWTWTWEVEGNEMGWVAMGMDSEFDLALTFRYTIRAWSGGQDMARPRGNGQRPTSKQIVYVLSDLYFTKGQRRREKRGGSGKTAKGERKRAEAG
ncbi:hypothetical protein F4780DRAFT_158562 [Xylariomycetidae sp. FL0641]|nr:hypothetical protein F4780DRAFT_158562 [Xylariomycetidae sp. FL0641]